MTNLTSFYTAQQNVTTSGTPVRLTAQSVPEGVSVLLKAKPANTGNITVGNSSSNALNTGTGFFRLEPGQSVTLEVTNVNLIWCDATVSGEGVEIFLEQSA